MVIPPDGNDPYVVDPEGRLVNFVQLHLRYPRIPVPGKHIVKDTPDGFLHPVLGINVGGPLLEPVIRPYVIESEYMVDMLVGQQNGPEVVNPVRQHLLPEIGPRINHDVRIVDGDEGSTSHSPVAPIGRRTDFTMAAYQGNALRGAGAGKGHAHLLDGWNGFAHGP